MRDGLLQPLGGAKGFALGLLVEALAGVVSGAGAVSATPGPDDQGVFLLAFDPGRFGPPADVAERLEAMLAYVLGRRSSRARSRCAYRARRCRRCRSTRTARFELASPLAERLATLAGELGIAPVTSCEAAAGS